MKAGLETNREHGGVENNLYSAACRGGLRAKEKPVPCMDRIDRVDKVNHGKTLN